MYEYINRIKETDRGTLQFHWFISSDKKEAEIIEVYAGSEAALKHKENLEELQEIIFRKFGAPYSLTIYGDPSPDLIESGKASKMDAKIFPFYKDFRSNDVR